MFELILPPLLRPSNPALPPVILFPFVCKYISNRWRHGPHFAGRLDSSRYIILVIIITTTTVDTPHGSRNQICLCVLVVIAVDVAVAVVVAAVLVSIVLH